MYTYIYRYIYMYIYIHIILHILAFFGIGSWMMVHIPLRSLLCSLTTMQGVPCGTSTLWWTFRRGWSCPKTPASQPKKSMAHRDVMISGFIVLCMGSFKGCLKAIFRWARTSLPRDHDTDTQRSTRGWLGKLLRSSEPRRLIQLEDHQSSSDDLWSQGVPCGTSSIQRWALRQRSSVVVDSSDLLSRMVF
jgi:hypothetical protein